MLMKKFLGATAREAMQKMKAELGPEALVISNRKSGSGVEILAMVESTPATAAPMVAPAAPKRAAPPPSQSAGSAPRGNGFTSLKDFAARVEAPQRASGAAAAEGGTGASANGGWSGPNIYAPDDARIAPATWPAAAQRKPEPVAAAPRGPSPGEQRLFEEIAAMKAMLQDQIAGQAWRDMTERRPLAVRLWREMVEAGFSPGLARAMADKLPDDHGEAEGRKWLASVLARNIRCVDPARDMVETGGVYALVGPTGVGKTTTTAKIAARCVVKYGAQALGLVTTDSYRIGAFDQLSIYGKILGVPVHSAQSYAELEATIATMTSKRLVLIDTTGMGQRDNRVAEQINLLNHPRIRRLLLVNAAVQAETLEDVARVYQGRAAGARPLAGVILTKVDEAAKLAGALDVVARHGLELQYVTNGQRVPEDLHAPASAALVHRALKAAADPVFAMQDNEVAMRAMPASAGGAQVQRA